VIAAAQPVQRPRDGKLLIVRADGGITHAPRARFVEFLRRGDLVIANNAATVPASLHGFHESNDAEIEVRLAGRSSLAPAIRRFTAVIFGAGDFRMRTEDRPLPPPLAAGDRLRLGPLSATIERFLEHPRLVSLRFSGSTPGIWEGIARHGRPIQYAHVVEPLALWDVWTAIAGPPVAFEPPSAGFALNWDSIAAMRARTIELVTVTLAAGLSSTGDPDLDRRLPFDEPYRIPAVTAAAVARARRQNRRILAVGTTVVRALEHAAARDGIVRAGDEVADQRIGPATPLRVVDAILSGTHEPDSSHYQMLRAFAGDDALAAASAALEAGGYRTHEFGDSMLVERNPGLVRRGVVDCEPCVRLATGAAA